MRLLTTLGVVCLALLIIYFAGPRPSKPVYTRALTAVPAEPAALDQYVITNEAKHKLKPGNNAEIIWYNSLHHKTGYSIVYLHGFSASREEGDPVHIDIARKFGCNLYLSRLAAHGIDTADALINFSAAGLWESAKEALTIGRQLGDKVILMGTSTGGSVALQLAAVYQEVAAVILLSPNIAINDPNAWLLNDPWGLQIARLVKHSDFNTSDNTTSVYKQYWNYQYRLEAAVQLEEYLETAMTRQTFSAVKQPVLTLYYYKDEQHQDPVVKVSSMRKMMKELGTPDSLKREQAIPNAGEHVLGSYILSKDIPSVESAITRFMQEVLKINERSFAYKK